MVFCRFVILIYINNLNTQNLRPKRKKKKVKSNLLNILESRDYGRGRDSYIVYYIVLVVRSPPIIINSNFMRNVKYSQNRDRRFADVYEYVTEKRGERRKT